MACPTPHKRKYLSKQDAINHTATFAHAIYVYQCEGCTAYHLTKMKPGQYKPRKHFLKYYRAFKKFMK